MKLGTTLYSLTAEWAFGLYDLDGLLAAVQRAGIGPGIELVASQTLRTYPHVSDDFVRNWHDTLDRYGFVAGSFAANLDMGRRHDRDMTPDEEYEFTEALFRSAHALGFPLVRVQSAKEELIRRLLPLAEELDIVMGYEIHAPYGPNSPEIVRIRELYDEIGSPRLGFVADFSSTMHGMSPTLLRTLRRMGLDDAALDELQRVWATDGSIGERAGAFAGYLGRRGIDVASLGPFARLAFNMQGHVDPREWSDIMPRIVHVHAKFYDIDEHGEEPSIDYRTIVREFVRGGYSGFFSSEWEGHAFADLGEADPLDLVARQHELIRRSIREALADA
ncbi:sugar phosphate isomerase/epimerase family protein [Thermocatellispora tengchongensis]|uniref:sugar phosphate isomerase/epimerase family protein n=1 Tax=Thermocatellispora tengchongensis TaxID=1073253 RepID=UPI00363B8E8C